MAFRAGRLSSTVSPDIFGIITHHADYVFLRSRNSLSNCMQEDLGLRKDRIATAT